MANDENERRAGYVVEIPYLDLYFPELTPAALAYAALVNGFPAPPLDGFAYCELGCGQGRTLAVLAASNPNATFVGCDINPEHVRAARDLAAAGELGNLSVYECDFAALAANEDLPAFDYVVAHGIWSWVGPEVRRTVLDFLRKRLKPGGLFYVSYNTMPGWAQAAPMRRLLFELAEMGKGSLPERASSALEFIRAMQKADLAFFRANPAIAAVLDNLSAKPINYIVHEYLAEHWEALYVTDVMRELSAAGLAYAGSAVPAENHPLIALPKSAYALVTGGLAPEVSQLVIDFALQRQFRRDVYSSGAHSRAASAISDAFRRQTVGRLKASGDLVFSGKGPGGIEFKFRTDFAERIAALLENGPRLVGELGLHVEAQDHDDDLAQQAVHAFIAARQMALFPADRLPPLRDGPLRYALPFNKICVERGLSRHEGATLAAPIAGTGLSLSYPQIVLLDGILKNDPDPIGSLDRLLANQNAKLMKDGRAVETESERHAALAEELTRVKRSLIPLALDLGVLLGHDESAGVPM
jgi:SAM-dependent methyltransferase